jgi:predicted nucleic acid-binding protein
MALGYLIDTNILLRLSRQDDPQHDAIQTALNSLDKQGAEFYFSLQNIAEFWNVCTRPVERNGFGLSIEETNQRVEAIERTMTLLPDNDRVYPIWRRLVRDNNVRGAQVHDARLAALMEAYGVPYILTLNQPDFARYSNALAIHPNQVEVDRS